jgi:hypothetical protein
MKVTFQLNAALEPSANKIKRAGEFAGIERKVFTSDRISSDCLS